MPPPTQSAIWTYFKTFNDDREKAQCKICLKTYSRKGRTTTSLKNHLKSLHPEQYSLYSVEVDKISQEKKDESKKVVSVTPLQASKKQLSLEEVIQKEKKWDSSHPSSKNIDKLIGEMIALQNLPFNFVEGLGFRRLMQVIAPKYNLKGRNFYTDYVCNELYEKVAEKVTESIQKFDYMSFTTDIWTDPSSNASLLSLTCHGIAENFDRSAIVSKCETFDDRHTGDIIAENFETMLTEWTIPKDKVHCMIRDEGLNIKRAMRIAELQDTDCTIHKMQLAIRRGLASQDNLKEIKKKCKTISTHFNHSTIAQKQLQKIQDRLTQPHLKLFQDCVTRWNSTFYMFERFLKVKDSLSLYMNDSDINPIMPEEWKIIECCVQLLKPFEEATRELSSSDALISSVIPITRMLIKKLDEHLTSPQDSDPIRLVVTTLKTEMSSRFSALEENNLFAVSTYLDPRYKHKFFNPLTEEKIKEEIVKANKNLFNVDDESLSSPVHTQPKRMRMENSSDLVLAAVASDISPEQPSTSSTARKHCLKSDLEAMLDSSSEDEELQTQTQRPDSPGTELKKELATYRSRKRINVSDSPLTWWTNNRQEFKWLAGIARRFLSSPPGSVPSEQLFSGAGLIYSPLRNRLEPEKASKLLFIKYNSPIYNFQY